jgi:hypothetical protein
LRAEENINSSALLPFKPIQRLSLPDELTKPQIKSSPKKQKGWLISHPLTLVFV